MKIDMWHFDSYSDLIDFVNGHQYDEAYEWENIKIVYDPKPKFEGKNWCLFYRREK